MVRVQSPESAVPTSQRSHQMAKATTQTIDLSPMNALVAWLQSETFAVSIGKRSGSVTNIPVPVADMPLIALQAIFSYGLQRKFNDAIGGSDTTPEQKADGVREMIEAFKRGEVAKARGTGESVDPVLAEIRSMIRPDVKKAWIADHDAEAWKGRDEAEINADIDAVFEAQDDATKAAIRTAAEAEVARKAEARKARAGVLSGLKVALAK